MISKKNMKFFVRVFFVRFLVMLFSIVQVTVWASEMQASNFGVAMTYLAGQALIAMIGRLGNDNILVKSFKTDENFVSNFLRLIVGVLLWSLLVGCVFSVFLSSVVVKSGDINLDVTFILLVLTFNLSHILSLITLAQKKQIICTLVGSALPVGCSIVLFVGLSKYLGGHDPISPHLGLLTLVCGYTVSSIVFALLLRKWLMQSWRKRASSNSFFPLYSREQWYFLGYQLLNNFRSHGVIIFSAGVFGPEIAGIYSLANRFGRVPTYLSEASRLYVTPNVAGESRKKLKNIFGKSLMLNAAMAMVGLPMIIGFILLFPFSFETPPTFFLYTFIIMAGAAAALLTGPCGAILAMNNLERKNFLSNTVGIVVTALLLALSWFYQNPLYMVVGVAFGSISTNFCNFGSLLIFLNSRPKLVERIGEPV